MTLKKLFSSEAVQASAGNNLIMLGGRCCGRIPGFPALVRGVSHQSSHLHSQRFHLLSPRYKHFIRILFLCYCYSISYLLRPNSGDVRYHIVDVCFVIPVPVAQRNVSHWSAKPDSNQGIPSWSLNSKPVFLLSSFRLVPVTPLPP
jgi:hypothetical protein